MKSTITRCCLMLMLAAICVSGSAVANQEPRKEGSPFMATPNDLKWTELPERKGMQFTVLTGDPKTGAYTQLRKVPGGTDNPLHSHGSELTNVIISGIWYTGADAASAKDFGPGSIVVMPANWVHVSGCRPPAECLFSTRRAKADSISNPPGSRGRPCAERRHRGPRFALLFVPARVVWSSLVRVGSVVGSRSSIHQ